MNKEQLWRVKGLVFRKLKRKEELRYIETLKYIEKTMFLEALKKKLQEFQELEELQDLQESKIRKLIQEGQFEEVEKIYDSVEYEEIVEYLTFTIKLSTDAEHFDFEIDPKKRGYLLRAEDIPEDFQIEMIVLIFHLEFEAELLFGEANWARFIDSISKSTEIGRIISENLEKAGIHSYRNLEELFTE